MPKPSACQTPLFTVDDLPYLDSEKNLDFVTMEHGTKEFVTFSIEMSTFNFSFMEHGTQTLNREFETKDAHFTLFTLLFHKTFISFYIIIFIHKIYAICINNSYF